MDNRGLEQTLNLDRDIPLLPNRLVIETEHGRPSGNPSRLFAEYIQAT